MHILMQPLIHRRVQPPFSSGGRAAGKAFLACRRRDLDLVFALQFERTVNRDNTVSFQNLRLQLERVGWRATLAGCQVMVHQHLDGSVSLTHGPRLLGRYTPEGVAQRASENAGARRAAG
jgi:hypothetical protein